MTDIPPLNADIPPLCQRPDCTRNPSTWCPLCEKFYCLEHDPLWPVPMHNCLRARIDE